MVAPRAWADVTVNPDSGTVASENDANGETSPFEPVGHPHRNRSVFWLPLASLVVPGLDQWIEGQTQYAFTYTGVAAAGLAYSSYIYNNANLADAQKKRIANEEAACKAAGGSDCSISDDSLITKDDNTRRYTLGTLIGPLGSAGGFSAYHAFRTAVRSHKAKGEYEFLTHEETPLDILKAPWNVTQLAKPRVFWPLLIGASLSYLQLRSPPMPGMTRDAFRSDDAFFTAAYSFNAGMWEEATFRGWLMPVMKQEWFGGIDDGWGNFWSNSIQATVFAIAHLSTNSTPIPQLALGWYLGFNDQRQGWTISEGIFIHAWWDVFAFATQYMYKFENPNNPTAQALRPVLWLPPFEYHF